MLDLIAGGSGTLYAITAAVLGVLALIWKAMKVGRQIERGKSDAEKNKGWTYADKDQQKAADARRAARKRDRDNLMSDDGHKRT